MSDEQVQAQILDDMLVMQHEMSLGTRCQKCARPRATAAQIAMWLTTYGYDYRGPEPEWSCDPIGKERLICWTKRSERCHNRISRDLKFLLARSEFIDYCKENGL